MTICKKCGYEGKGCHCSGCHCTFHLLFEFDAHRTRPTRIKPHGGCKDPVILGMYQTDGLFRFK